MRKSILQYFMLSIILGIATIVLNACNSGTSSNNAKFGHDDILLQLHKLRKNSGFGINYTLDGESLTTDTQNWNDMGWHLLTLTVSSVMPGQSPEAVNGIGAFIGSPTNPKNYGESVVVQDINCNSATFANVGDTCSTYVKVSYDYAQYPTVQPVITVNLYPGNWQNIPVWIQPHDWIQPPTTVGIYRPIHTFEAQYYSGANVNSNPNQYSMLLMQNGSVNPINVTNVGIPTNQQNFQIIHRTVAGNDPYYGNNSECSTAPNTSIGQESALSNVTDSCIVIYSTTQYATQADTYDSVAVGSNANSVFPSWAGSYNLHAHYTVASPLPNQGFSTVHGAYNTPMPIDQFEISYNFTPNPLQILGGSNGAALILPQGTNVWSGEPILTSLGAPTTITAVNPQFPDGEVDQNGGSAQSHCGETPATANGQIYQSQALTQQGQFNITIQINSYAHCGAPAPQNFSLNIPFNNYYSQPIYAVDQQGCGGGNWDIGAYAMLYGFCSNSSCSYTLALTSTHGGTGGQCHGKQVTNIPFSFTQPTTNIVANLNSGNAPITFAAPGGQQMYGAIGTASGAIAQSISCDTSNTCNASGVYSNGQSSTGMSYQINLDPGDVLNNGLIQFTRSSGYQLNSFSMQATNQ